MHLQKTCPVVAPLYNNGYTVAELKGESLLETSSAPLQDSVLSSKVSEGARVFIAKRASASAAGKPKRYRARAKGGKSNFVADG